jgi:hypothetical protein
LNTPLPRKSIRPATLSLLIASTLVLAGCGGSSHSPAPTPTPAPTPQAAAPTFTPVAGTYTAAQTVTITDTTPGAAIYYTTDGTTPTTASSVYSQAIPLAATATVEALAAASGYTNSAVSSATYTLNIPVAATPAPTISPNGGTFTSATTVTLADSASGATIYYTLDGSTPTTSSTTYSAPFTISAPGATTVSAIAVTPGTPASSVTTAAFTLNLVSSNPTYAYKNVQIVGGGFVDGLYFHPKSKGLMYAKTDIGGAYRWNNVSGGDTQWVPLLNFVGRFESGFDQGVESLAIDPNDPQKLYLAVGEYADSYGDTGVILISDDMGNTFTEVPLPIKFGSNDIGRNIGERLVVDPNNSQHLYLATRLNGLYESNDGAHTWAQVAAFPVKGPSSDPEDPEVGVIFEDFIAGSSTVANGNTKTVYIGVSSPTVGLYISNDGGVTFTPVTGQPTGFYPNATSIDTTNGILYVTYGLNNTPGCSPNCDNSGPYGPDSGQVWKYQLPTSQQPTGTWSQITPPQTTPAGGAYSYGSVIVDPNHPNVVMVTLLNKYYPQPLEDIFRSVDSGATWVNINTNIKRDLSLSPWVAFGQTDANGNPIAGPGNWSNHLVVDPFNSNHVMYGSGQTIWQTMDIGDADGVATSTSVVNHANATNWAIGAQGLEETDILQMVSPPSGPADLVSEMGDLGGFTHTDLNHSPTTGQQSNPAFTTGSGVDFAQNNPLIMARVGSPSYASTLAGAYSSDGGLTWKPFATQPAGITSGGGTIAVSADGSTFVWMPYDVGVAASYSTDNGNTWTASTGAPAQINNYTQETILADRVNPKKFYLFDPQGSNGATPLYVSTDGAHTFTLASTPANYDIALYVSPAAEGDLWLSSNNGLFHSTDSGATFASITGTKTSYNLGFGASAPGSTYPTIYMVGLQSSDTLCTDGSDPSVFFTVASTCLYRSVDEGKTFIRINDLAHQYGYINTITGDSRVFGRIFLGTAGRGIIEGDSPN